MVELWVGGGQRDRRTLAGDTHQLRETSVNAGIKKRMKNREISIVWRRGQYIICIEHQNNTGSKKAELGEEWGA